MAITLGSRATRPSSFHPARRSGRDRAPGRSALRAGISNALVNFCDFYLAELKAFALESEDDEYPTFLEARMYAELNFRKNT